MDIGLLAVHHAATHRNETIGQSCFRADDLSKLTQHSTYFSEGTFLALEATTHTHTITETEAHTSVCAYMHRHIQVEMHTYRGRRKKTREIRKRLMPNTSTLNR